MKFRWLAVLVLAAIALWGIAGFTPNPLLYAPEKDPTVSQFHANPEALLPEATNSSDYMSPLMENSLSDQLPIVTALRVHDIDTMDRNLISYNDLTTLLQEETDWFGMNGGEIRTFITGTHDQGAVLAGFATQERARAALVAAGKQSPNDTAVQKTVASQVVTVGDTEKALLTRYLDDHTRVLQVATKLGLDTRAYVQARDELTQFVQEPKATEVPPAVTVAGPPPEPGITLLVVPDLAVYRDTVQVFGLVTPPFPGQNVTVYLDSAPFLNVTPGSTGDYLTKFTIERIASGNHTLVSTTGNFTSDEQVLVVQQIGTTTLLRAVPGYTNFSEPGVYCNGTVTANLPVRSAPVLILADGDTAANLSTAGDGSFGAFLALPSGRHTIVAQFLADGYPLNGSESDPVTVVVPAVPIRLADILIVAAVLIIIAIAAAGIWLVRHPPESGSRLTGAEEELLDGILPETLGLQTIPVEPDIPPEAGALLARYEAMLREHGLSEAARRAYLDLAGRIAKSLRVKGYRTLTPRELSGACAKRSYGGIFDLFVESYERIRYGGSADLKDREGLEEELQVADRETGREQP